MKLYVTLLSSLILSVSAFAQMKILFVDDSDDIFLNTETIHMAIEEVGYKAHYFNSLDSFDLLTADYLSQYDLVVWQMSNDGTKLGLWNQSDTDNNALKSYLDQGGKLWLGGLDFLYDKYGTAPKVFESGEFVYDYVGLSSYDFQSYGDDGGLGVPILNPEDTCVIENLVPVRWNFPTLWWVDGVTPRLGAHTIYRMGDDAYVGHGKIAGVLHTTPSFEVLSCYFDLGVAFEYEMIKASVKPVLQYFDAKISRTTQQASTQHLTIVPNPSTNSVQIISSQLTNQFIDLFLVDTNGRIISNQQVNRDQNLIDVSMLPSGTYMIVLKSDNATIRDKLVKM